MATVAEVKALLDRYCKSMSDKDRETWLDCFADDAVQEDPVGTTPNVGRAAIGAFFDSNPVPIHIYQTQDPIVIGNDAAADKFGGLFGYPTSVLIDKDGKQIKRITGIISEDEISKLIEAQL